MFTLIGSLIGYIFSSILSGFFFFILLIIFLIIHIYVSKQFRNVAYAKGYQGKKYFWIPFFLPPIGYLLIISLPDLTLRNALWKIAEPKKYNNIEEQPRVKPKQEVTNNYITPTQMESFSKYRD